MKMLSLALAGLAAVAAATDDSKSSQKRPIPESMQSNTTLQSFALSASRRTTRWVDSPLSPGCTSNRQQMLLVVDHQVGLYNTARDFDPNLFRDQVLAHAALGKVFDIPVVLTTSTQEGMSRLHLSPCFPIKQMVPAKARYLMPRQDPTALCPARS